MSKTACATDKYYKGHLFALAFASSLVHVSAARALHSFLSYQDASQLQSYKSTHQGWHGMLLSDDKQSLHVNVLLLNVPYRALIARLSLFLCPGVLKFWTACRALEEAELRFRMEELEALEAAFGDIEAGAGPPGPALPLPPPPGRYTSWHSSLPLSENAARPRCVLLPHLSDSLLTFFLFAPLFCAQPASSCVSLCLDPCSLHSVSWCNPRFSQSLFGTQDTL